MLLAGFVARSWYGVAGRRQAVSPTVERRQPLPAKPAARMPSAHDSRLGVRDALLAGPGGETIEAS
jgi:hypothetical protein